MVLSLSKLAALALLGLLPSLFLGRAARADDVVEVVITDALGNIRVITDDKGNILERHDYLPFGEECTAGPCASNPGVGAGQPRKFTGKERDAETGLDYFGARYYRANTGRFTTVDPVYTWRENLLDPQRWNRYAYARNNPLRYIDPNGEQVAEAVRQWGQQVQTWPDQRAVAIGGALIIVAANIDKLGDIGQAIIESGAFNNTQPGYPGVDIGMDRKMSGYLFNENAGIYEFPDAQNPGKTYVGQSGNKPRRLKEHEKTGKKAAGGEADTTDVEGGKTAREVAEQRRINELGGTREKPGSSTSNVRNPIGPRRAAEMEKQ